MNPTLKRGLLGLALLSTVAAAWFAPAEKEDGVALSQHAKGPDTHKSESTVAQAGSTARSTTAAPSVPVAVLRIRSRMSEDEEPDLGLFTPTQWTPPSIAAPVRSDSAADANPTPPQAPPLPFQVLGRYEDVGQAVVFLQYKEQNLVVRVGDTIAQQYKVESLTGTSLGLRYLPLNLLQTLDIGSAP